MAARSTGDESIATGTGPTCSASSSPRNRHVLRSRSSISARRSGSSQTDNRWRLPAASERLPGRQNPAINPPLPCCRGEGWPDRARSVRLELPLLERRSLGTNRSRDCRRRPSTPRAKPRVRALLCRNDHDHGALPPLPLLVPPQRSVSALLRRLRPVRGVSPVVHRRALPVGAGPGALLGVAAPHRIRLDAPGGGHVRYVHQDAVPGGGGALGPASDGRIWGRFERGRLRHRSQVLQPCASAVPGLHGSLRPHRCRVDLARDGAPQGWSPDIRRGFPDPGRDDLQ